MTPHISAKKNEIAKTVLMCGDPLRAKFFATQFLTNPKLVNEIRGMYAFTGMIKNTNVEITVMGHGMGLDSIGIYSFELFKFYDVENIIRFGSAGAYFPEIELGSIVVANKSFTESNFGVVYGQKESTIEATPKLLDIVKNLDSPFLNSVKFGTVNSSSWFYQTTPLHDLAFFQKNNILCVEMESFALYAIAKVFNKNALTVLTISDNIPTEQKMDAKTREIGFDKMFNLIIAIAKKI